MNSFFTALRTLLLLVSVAGAAGTVCSVFRQESPAPTRQEFELKLRYALNLPLPEPEVGTDVSEGSLRKGGHGHRLISREARKHGVAPELIFRAAKKYGLDPAVIAGLIERESDFDPRAAAADGGRGLMQLMPEVCRERNCRDPFDPAANIEAGTAHLADLYGALESIPDPEERISFALAAYNGGLGHVFDARQVARELQLDPDRWEGNVEEAIQFLKFRSFYTRFRHGKCNADIVVNYVRSVRALADTFAPES
ncbi:MAG: transglycosylase SLT domain-containing protein [Lentisphaeria bacterium]|nr:transglycosylase SLT domain-containing protein [Lentisphaeria bacterium]